MIENFTPEFGESVSLRNSRTDLFLKMYGKCKKDVLGKYAAADAPWTHISPRTDEKSRPEPVTFSWICDIPREKLNIVLHISKTPDFKNEITAEIGALTAFARYNLEVGQKYYWYVENLGEICEKSGVTSFVTSDEYPRMIYVDGGGTNVRDLGGITNIDGVRVRQGLLYRGASIDYNRSLSDEGFRVLREDLGVKTDLDLRLGDFSDEDPLIRDERESWLERCFVRGSGYGMAATDSKAYADMAELFGFMCRPEIYPAYLHCRSGIDRTGTVMYLLGLILRIDEEKLLLDYEISVLGYDGWHERRRELLTEEFIGNLRPLGDDGDDVYRLAEIYFEKCLGLPDALIKLREIFLDE
ncbi:MAG: tyrosine-protein phosphatase [Clostridiales bacterium]|nr:tyrosine-protein phosphatase [Clostridiales bacterium]